MKRVSFVALLTIVYPELVLGYQYTITDENIRNHSYSVEQINQTVYDTALSQDVNAPVFQTVENDETIYYRWYVSDLTDTNNRITNASGSINQNFINNTYQCHSNDCGGGAIYNSSLTSITGDFVNNSTDVDHFAGSGGGAIYNMSSQPINSITGDFINNHSSAMAGAINNGGSMYAGNSNMTITTITGNFINNYGWGFGGAVYNKGNIGSFDSDFISNKLIGDTNSSGGAIYNDGVIGSVDGNFTNNIVSSTTHATAGGAIYNNGLINSINSDFINNIVVGTKGGTGGAIFNGYNATINSIIGNFVGNSADGDFGNSGAIENYGTINSITGNFINNSASYRGGAIQNYGNITFTNNVLFSGNSADPSRSDNWSGAILNYGEGKIYMNIDGESTIRFNTVSDVITNDGTITATGTTIGTPGHLYLQSVTNSGSFILNNIYAELADGQRIEQKKFSIDENSTLYTNGGTLIINSLVNNGTIVLDGGTFASNVTGSGNITISGDVVSDVSINQNTIITDTGSLTASFENIENSNITNNGLILFSDGVLNKNVSNFSGNVGNGGWLSANANYMDKIFTNRGTLILTGGTLAQNIIGSGDIEVDGDVVSNTAISQNININTNKSLTISADNINADVHNQGVLRLTGGTLTSRVTGITGNMIIGGDVIANTDVTQNVTINSGKSLTSSVDNIKNANIVANYGTLWFNDGTLDKVLSNYGNAGNIGTLNANANLINRAFVNNGTLNLTEGVLNSKITGSGETFITGDVTNMTDYSQVVNIANGGKLTTNADLLTNNAAINNAGILNINNGVLKNDVIGGKTIIGNNAVLESKNIADIDMGGTWNIDSDTVHASNANVNGLINIDITKINADSDKYAGGKLIADNIILDKNSELRLFVSANNLKKGESTGDLSVIEASAWDGNWHNIFQTNNKYDLSYDDIMHTVKITYTKTAADIILEFGGSKNDIAVGTAWDNESVFSDEFIDFAIRKMIERLNYAIQYDIEDYIKMLESIAPNDTHVASGTSRSVNNAINNQVSNRLAHVGRSGGDAFSGVGVWGQGLFNHSNQSGSADFSANTFGLSLGADKKINNTTLFGLGYAFNNTTAVSGARDISSIGHTVFVYGEYRPMLLSKDSGYRASRFHVNGMASYGVASYTEDTYDGVSSEYDTTSIGLNGNIEYDITSAFSLFTGGRYIKVSQDDYFDSLGQKVSVQDEDIITARVGAKYVGDYSLFVPNAHIGISYDVKSSDRLAIVNTANSSYQITGDAISPFGVQAGIGFVMNIDDWDISLNYDLDWHYEFISHTGRIKAKYMF